ncbi:MBL fold metallo-hydrolase [Actinocatenispora thailandica]|uniref:MBL fold metallo-hydrolase n=1 Tax=Actinocatenispora thailandica TaxID=227318 RepID=A0A7R7I090_9ACTN|nr:MBL fold metallo-hydrolase [Actinocatenispora thailandica]BCJ37778.1 MBL fold metallo-hydrolase [Actinocatenispora thailandica]
MSTVEFFGGLGVIGSSKILVSHGGHRVLLDIGLDIPAGGDLFRAPVTPRPGRDLADRLRVGAAPRIPGLFDPALLPGADEDRELAALAQPAGETAVFVSHPHLDHVGLAGFVRPDLGVHAHHDAVRLLAALADTGAGLPGREPAWRPLHDGEIVHCGEISVECVPVDHDVPGASGYLVRTPDGVLAYTGDIRFHGRHPDRSESFVDRAAGCDLLVTEGTTLGWPAADGRPRDEDDVAASYRTLLRETSGLILLALYPRDVERAAEFVACTETAGRRLLWPAQVAAFLNRLGVAAESADSVPPAQLHAAPGDFVVAPEPYEFPALLDLPLSVDSAYVHANGEPLGAFDPRWSLLTGWLATLSVPLHTIGCSGHASQDDLHRMVQRIHPATVAPIHTTEPTRLHPPIGTRRLVPEYGTRYTLTGDPL